MKKSHELLEVDSDLYERKNGEPLEGEDYQTFIFILTWTPPKEEEED